MINLVKKYYNSLSEKLDSRPAKISRYQKIVSGLFFLVFLSGGLSVTNFIRPYIYQNKLYHYYDIIGSAPSFLSVPCCYFFCVFIDKIKNRRYNTNNYGVFLAVTLLANFLYEIILSNTFDWKDMIAIFLGAIPVIVIETIFRIFKTNDYAKK